MSKLEKLIQELCPNGVEYKKVEDIFLFKNGKGHEQSIDPEGKYIVVNSKYISSDGKTVKKCKSQIEPVFKGNILMVMSDLPNGKALAKCFLVDENDKYSLNQRICSLNIKDNDKYLPKFYYYVFNRHKNLLKFDNGVDQTNLKKEHINNIFVPVPPIEVQSEIVRILDNFTLLTAELTAELTARKQQYEYYRDYLLNFENKKITYNVEYKTIGDVTRIERGVRITKKDLIQDGKYPVISGGTKPLGYINNFNRRNGTITIAQYGSAGYVDIQNHDFWANDVCYSVFPSSEIENRYLYYCLVNNQELLYSLTTKAIPDHLPLERLKAVIIPIPPKKVQSEISNLLDNFNIYCKDTTKGLPAEIELRQKQYEYYRDKLLTFKEL